MKFAASIAKFAAAAVLGLSAHISMASVTVGSYDAGNCYPFSCLASDGWTRYQQVYNANQFTGTTQISGVTFFRDLGGLMDTASYSISFYLTPNGLGSDPSDNQGSLLSNFGSFNIGGSMPAELTLWGNVFSYDSSLGNLLMDVSLTGLTVGVGYESFFQADYTGQATMRGYGDDSVLYVDNGALVTRFETGEPPINVPEPSGLALIGLAALGLLVARRKAIAVH